MGTYALGSNDEVLLALIDRVIGGETILIERDGMLVAELCPPARSAIGPASGATAGQIEREEAHPPVDAASAKLLEEFNEDEEE